MLNAGGRPAQLRLHQADALDEKDRKKIQFHFRLNYVNLVASVLIFLFSLFFIFQINRHKTMPHFDFYDYLTYLNYKYFQESFCSTFWEFLCLMYYYMLPMFLGLSLYFGLIYISNISIKRKIKDCLEN